MYNKGTLKNGHLKKIQMAHHRLSPVTRNMYEVISAQKLEAEWYYRPSDQDILKQFEYQGQSNTISELPQDGKWIITNVDLTDISHFGGWTEASKKHFADGGLFDSIYEEKN